MVIPKLRFLSYIDFSSSLVFSRLKLINFNTFHPKLFGLDWVCELTLVVESRFPVDTIPIRRLLATGTPCACGNKLKQRRLADGWILKWTIFLSLGLGLLLASLIEEEERTEAEQEQP